MNEVIQKQRTLTGEIVSDRMHKTIIVSVVRKIPHPKYGKYVKRRTKLFVHDPENKGNIGDTALISAHRPISKKKNWVLVSVISKNIQNVNS